MRDRHYRRTEPERYHRNQPGIDLDGKSLNDIRERIRGSNQTHEPQDSAQTSHEVQELSRFDDAAFAALLELRRDRRIGWRAIGLGNVIAGLANKDTGEACPSRATLSEITGITQRNISGTVRELEQVGFLTVMEREGMANVYRLTYQKNTNAGIADEDWQREAQNMAEGTGER